MDHIDIIKRYYSNNLYTQLKILDILSDDKIQQIIDFFNLDIYSLNYDKKPDLKFDLRKKSSTNIEKSKVSFNLDNKRYNDLKKKTNLILDQNLNIEKSKISAILDIISQNGFFSFINKNKLIDFSTYLAKHNPILEEKILYIHSVLRYLVLQVYLEFINNINFFRILINNLLEDDKSFYNIIKLFNIMKYLEFNINFNLFHFGLRFYVYILKKYTGLNVIFPVFFKTNNNLLVSIIEDNEKAGSAIATDREIENLKKKVNIKEKEPYYKNLFTKDDVENIEMLLKSSKIDNLIKNKELNLSPEYQNILNQLKTEEKAENKKKYLKDLFFIKNDTHADELLDIYSKVDDKDKFLQFMMDKLIYYKNLNNSSSNELISVMYDVVETGNFKDNSFNLTETDMKFIVILETLDTIKKINNSTPISNSPNNEKSNLIVNVFKNTDQIKINDKSIEV